jgi:hypothetical protein
MVASSPRLYRHRMMVVQEVLASTEQNYEQKRAKHLDMVDKLNEELQNLATSRAREMTLQETRELLVKGIGVLTDTVDRWTSLVQLFQQVRAVIDHQIVPTLHKVRSMSTIVRDNGDTQAEFLLDIIVESVRTANKYGLLIGELSGSYVTISTQYLMPEINKIPRLLYHPMRSASDDRLAR